MKAVDNKTKFSFKRPAVYKIKVLGDLNESYSDRLGGMQITIDRSVAIEPVSILIGQINDQAALSGVLNTLYELQLSIISVNILKDS